MRGNDAGIHCWPPNLVSSRRDPACQKSSIPRHMHQMHQVLFTSRISATS